MSLSKQLISLIVGLFLLVFVGTLAISIQNTRDFLYKQLKTHARDTAHALGLRLTPAVAGKDLPLMESTVDAIFDSGYYSRIVIRDMKGKVILDRKPRIQHEKVPDWFIRTVRLTPPEASSTITTGWKQIATVSVTSHPGHAYEDLWRITVQNFWWLLALGAVALVAVISLVRLVLKPLRAVERQALAISAREFPIQERLPRTKELRRVVKAMNYMSAKVEDIINSLTRRTEEMRARAYHDDVTVLQNRRSFEERLQHILHTHDEYRSGLLIIISLDGLKEVNTRHGYARGDAMLQETALCLLQACRDKPGAQVARIGGADFGIFLPNITLDGVQHEIDDIRAHVVELDLPERFGDGVDHHAGCAWYTGIQSLAELLAAADTSLRMAQEREPGHWECLHSDMPGAGRIRQASEWKQVLDNVIEKRAITLHFQPVRSPADETLLHQEVLVRLREEEGDLVNAAIFMPMIHRHDMHLRLDKLIVETLIETLPQLPAGRYAINLAPATTHDPAFHRWLEELLTRNKSRCPQLIFETTDYAAVTDHDALHRLIETVHRLGARFSIDHFGIASTSFGYLRTLKLDYLKIDGSFIRHIEVNEDNQFFVRSLTDIAHGLDIQVIAEYVERDEELNTLTAMRLDGVQGYLIGKPGTLN